jgi:molecular chaperone DnaJ
VAVQADWLERDLYAVLGVEEGADSKTISRAYRKLARELHPDTHPDDAEATERFKGVTAAYDVLGDKTKRAEYDQFRRAVAGADRSDGRRRARSWSGGDDFTADHGQTGYEQTGYGQTGYGQTGYEQTGNEQTGNEQTWSTFDGSTWTAFDPGDVDDLLGRVMGRTGRRRATTPWRGDDFETVLDVSFEDAVQGLTSDVTLNRPDGSQTFKVRVPAGVDDGQRIRLPGKGGPGANGGPPGDLYAIVRVAPHPTFGRSGLDLSVEAPIGWPEAVLGAEIDVPTLGGSPVRVRVPAGTPHGRTLRVRGRGVRTDKDTGDLLVGLRLTVPDRVTEAQRQAVQAVAEAFQAA